MPPTAQTMQSVSWETDTTTVGGECGTRGTDPALLLRPGAPDRCSALIRCEAPGQRGFQRTSIQLLWLGTLCGCRHGPTSCLSSSQASSSPLILLESTNDLDRDLEQLLEDEESERAWKNFGESKRRRKSDSAKNDMNSYAPKKQHTYNRTQVCTEPGRTTNFSRL